MSVDLILQIAAAVCFLAAAVNVKVGSVNILAVGLFLWVLSVIL